ncbi:hypothetical protein [uncultured Imperialibacter sp.]|uniref:hypothetical protein n=1 Tax=uncultured Imperialibacter sp. TaxID=1672639 RepID=UPI0030DB22C1|tara:strand:- start:17701 stop:19065 length:1365 start_codon:yes stop_codon:yes gene_type:complete
MERKTTIAKASVILLFFLVFSAARAQESQNTILNGFESGNYTVYKLGEKGKFEKVGKPWPVVITKQGGNVSEVLVKRSGILDEPFTPDVPGYPAYFAFKDLRLSFLNDYGVYYEWNGKQEATTKYVLVKEGGNFNLDPGAINKLVAAYATATFKNQTSARDNVKAEKAELAEAERKANSLEEKVVAKIDIQLTSQPAKVAHFSEAIKYGVVATLKDGSTLKTPNLGGKIPWEDFELAHKGCSNTIDEVRVDVDASSLTDDVVLLQITSVYHPSLKASLAINTTNDVSVQVSQNGFWGNERHQHMTVFQGVDGQHAGNGDDLVIKVQAVRHKKTGASLNKIEIYNTTKAKTVAHYKLTPDTPLIVNAKGGQGMNGSKGRQSETAGGNGGNGGSGGSVTIIKDPSVASFNITINNQGGKGGNGGPPYYNTGIKGNDGNPGADGYTDTKIASVNLNF